MNSAFAAVTQLLKLCLKILLRPLSWKQRSCLRQVDALRVLAALGQGLRTHFFFRKILTIKLIYQTYTHQNTHTCMILLWDLIL